MKKLRNFLSRFRLVYRRSSMLTKIVVLTTLALTTVTVLTLSIARMDAKRREEAARKEVVAYIQANQELRDKISILGTVESVKVIAEEVLGLVDPDTVIYDVQTED